MSWRSEADGHPALSGLSPAGLVLVTLMECLFFNSLNLVICFWLCWVFIAVRAFSLVVVSKGPSLVMVCGLLTAVASLIAEHRLQACGLQWLRHMDSVGI